MNEQKERLKKSHVDWISSRIGELTYPQVDDILVAGIRLS